MFLKTQKWLKFIGIFTLMLSTTIEKHRATRKTEFERAPSTSALKFAYQLFFELKIMI